jgi:hypothetical protein
MEFFSWYVYIDIEDARVICLNYNGCFDFYSKSFSPLDGELLV